MSSPRRRLKVAFHSRRQSSCRRSTIAPFANHLIRWDFAELAEVLGVTVPHVNRTEREPVIWPAAIRERFAERYAADLKLWEECPLPAHTAAKSGED